jgi:hypothetical protein
MLRSLVAALAAPFRDAHGDGRNRLHGAAVQAPLSAKSMQHCPDGLNGQDCAKTCGRVCLALNPAQLALTVPLQVGAPKAVLSAVVGAGIRLGPDPPPPRAMRIAFLQPKMMEI